MAALLSPNIPLALATAPLAGALLGFLRYNFNGATVFLGDSGSLLIGFLLGCFSVFWSSKSATIFGMTAPLMTLVVPLLDTGLAIVRRYLRRQPIFSADRGHIHHRLLARGLTPRRVVVLMYVVCGVAGCLSLLQCTFQNQFGGAIMILFCLGTWFGIQHLGYAEFEAARRIVRGGAFRHLLNAELQIMSLRGALAEAATPDECWAVLRQTYTAFGFNEIKVKLGNRTYAHSANGNPILNSWTMQIPLSETEYVTLSREFEGQASLTIAPFADIVGSILRGSRIRTQQHPVPASDHDYATSHSVVHSFANEKRQMVKQVGA
jgi:UDP-GlcNAc:undecaprenyl-phosphate GlcNAc-1-phosphate transferase